jgi:hypothetical protein
MYGSGGFSFTATGTLTSTGGVTPAEMAGAAAFSITATGALLQPESPFKPAGSTRPKFTPWAPWPHHAVPHRRPRKRRQDDLLFLGR